MSASVLFDSPGPRGRRTIAILNGVGVLLALVVVGLALWKFGQEGQLEASRWTSLLTSNAWTNYFLPGLRSTLLAALFAVVLALAFGLAFGLGRLAPYRVVRMFAGAVVEFFRAVPVLIMMIALWLGLGYAKVSFIPSTRVPLVAVVVALMLYNGSIIAELVRSGVHGLPRGQREAAASIGMTHNQSLAYVQLPQALLAMLPSLVSQFVIILKDSALGYIITFNEFLQLSRQFGAANGNMLQALVLCAVVFIVINWLLTKLADWVARRLSSHTSGRTAPRTPLPVQRAADEAAGP
ncbi:amino acid ABC transporter membrane protein 2 (PAAT family) [Salana multivorans]|uniref:Amino acid ABC transporter membrane protein 2 (PAAT family) n=1 Tax=Salana multivorans TaxID=120377 RepID=A0A3N2D264_9MICO|nr:amino acid ABC transporter permease [Salana multivorans]MBN8881426.1 amino acid ABC transporter permease [Salana multivorans]OJX95630.1 MAG: amino acid ABC transporter permease [Micrococcales bacterium 73-15]ROR93876.1 amino acid ABC transporter membrane protein 2 (PAAT family) [Salana multivorans]